MKPLMLIDTVFTRDDARAEKRDRQHLLLAYMETLECTQKETSS